MKTNKIILIERNRMKMNYIFWIDIKYNLGNRCFVNCKTGERYRSIFFFGLADADQWNIIELNFLHIGRFCYHQPFAHGSMVICGIPGNGRISDCIWSLCICIETTSRSTGNSSRIHQSNRCIDYWKYYVR